MSADASMLCDGALMSAVPALSCVHGMRVCMGQHLSDCTKAWSASQQAEHMPVQIVRDNAMLAIHCM